MSIEALSQETIEEYEKLIEEVLESNYGTLASFYAPSVIEGLKTNLIDRKNKGLMHPAGIGKKFTHTHNLIVRGDLISWIDNDSTDQFERAFLDKMSSFVTYLNETCYTAINDFEFHYAFYDVGSFYKRHKDQFHSDKGRKFSFVTYLNDNWQDTDGGQLSLYLENNEVVIRPKSGNVVFFKSNEIEHEVHPTITRSRLSIAGWLKSV
jgi:SM-20-related protein